MSRRRSGWEPVEDMLAREEREIEQQHADRAAYERTPEGRIEKLEAEISELTDLVSELADRVRTLEARIPKDQYL